MGMLQTSIYTFEGLIFCIYRVVFFSPCDFSLSCFSGVGVYVKGREEPRNRFSLVSFFLLPCGINHFLLLSNVNFLPLAAQIRTLLVS